MERFKQNPISTILGLLFIVAAFVFLFVPTLYDIPFMGLVGLWAAGLLLCFAKDKFLDIITLGLSRFVQDTNQRLK